MLFKEYINSNENKKLSDSGIFYLFFINYLKENEENEEEEEEEIEIFKIEKNNLESKDEKFNKTSNFKKLFLKLLKYIFNFIPWISSGIFFFFFYLSLKGTLNF
jgi:hypothetical protein